jgi:CRP-like cAMP-binding protein
MQPQRVGNRLLDSLSIEERGRVRSHLERIELPAARPIHEPGELAEHAIFPTSGVISLVATMEDGTSIEVGMIGREGMFSASAVLGDDHPTHRAMVQIAGSGMRLPIGVLRHEAQTNAKLQALLLRYVQLTLNTASQVAACNRLHALEQRLARWLLEAHDRTEMQTFMLTHEFLAMMLGVRRQGVTLAAQNLQAAGIIAYSHGNMTIVDRKRLEATSCECYRAVREEVRRLLGPD